MLGRLATTIPIVALWLPTSLQAANPWPGESSSAALKLTSLDPEFTSDISGAYWNGTARTFWVCRNNPGTFWALQQNSNGIWQIATNASRTKARWAAGGDLEGICQVNVGPLRLCHGRKRVDSPIQRRELRCRESDSRMGHPRVLPRKSV